MFDTYVHRREEHHHSHSAEVHEHRAPTDASVKLLKEMEQAARDKVLSSVKLEGCEVSCVIHRSEDFANFQELFLIRYRLGGKERTIRHKSDLLLREKDERQKLCDELLDLVSRDIAAHILGPAMRSAANRL